MPDSYPYAEIAGYTIEQVSEYSGMPIDQLSKNAIAFHHTLIHPGAVQQRMPEFYSAVSSLLEWPENFESAFAGSAISAT